VRGDIGEVYVQMFDVALANRVGEPPGLCIHSETCGRALALEHTGDLYSCDPFVEPKFKLGNIKETHMLELVASQQQRKFEPRQARHIAEVLPRVRRALRLPRRLPEGPLHR
jgi:serine-type anaerobic sulfatase-maturating enzyme